jgi:hypothetical protein
VSELPETMTLRPSRVRWLMLFLVAMVLSSAAVWAMADFFPALRWVVGIFFGVAAVIALLNVIGVASKLELKRESFTCTTLFRSFTRKWADCSTFDPVRMGVNRFVGFTSAEDDAAKPKLSANNKHMIGHSGMLPDTYGLTAEELAALMNRFRARAMG